MSAIVGIYQQNKEPLEQQVAELLMNQLSQFPADKISKIYNERLFFGCYAQWITPESIQEENPYYDDDRKLAIVADAIIDNREELFQLLMVERREREKISDTQLILYAYRKWGKECPKYLIGDFAFMIWDEREERLFGARDFSGARTLYYTTHSSSLFFCTTMAPLLSLPNRRNHLNEQWLAEYLAIIGMVDVVDMNLTPYEHIYQLPPSYSISVQKQSVVLKQYRSLDSVKKLKLKTDDEYVEAFQDVFGKAISARVRTHKQVGIQLSGGLDSGSIAAFAYQELKDSPKKLKTFSYIPPKDFKDFTPKHLIPNETAYITSTVQHIGGMESHILPFENQDSFSEIELNLNIMEMPYKFFENSYWMRGMFAEASGSGVGVLLNGGRGNLSISWGASLDYYAFLLKRIRWLKLLQELQHFSQRTGGPRLKRIPMIAKRAFPIPFRKNTKDYPTLINEDFARKTKVYQKLKSYGIDESGWFASQNVFKQRARHFQDLFHWNASNTWSAKLSLPYSVWKRDATNDLRVIQFCLSLPEDQYVMKGLDRALIRRATKGLLPDKVRLNQQTRGVQGADWVHRMLPHWPQFLTESKKLLTHEKLLMYVNREELKLAIQKAEKGIDASFVMDPRSKVLMRSMVLAKFLDKFL